MKIELMKKLVPADQVPMDIGAKPGTTIIFAFPKNGYEHDQKVCAKHLTVGQTYIIDRTHVGDCHTSVWLKEVPGVAFNSVMFSDQ